MAAVQFEYDMIDNASNGINRVTSAFKSLKGESRVVRRDINDLKEGLRVAAAFGIGPATSMLEYLGEKPSKKEPIETKKGFLKPLIDPNTTEPFLTKQEIIDKQFKEPKNTTLRDVLTTGATIGSYSALGYALGGSFFKENPISKNIKGKNIVSNIGKTLGSNIGNTLGSNISPLDLIPSDSSRKVPPTTTKGRVSSLGSKISGFNATKYGIARSSIVAGGEGLISQLSTKAPFLMRIASLFNPASIAIMIGVVATQKMLIPTIEAIVKNNEYSRETLDSMSSKFLESSLQTKKEKIFNDTQGQMNSTNWLIREALGFNKRDNNVLLYQIQEENQSRFEDMKIGLWLQNRE